MKTRLAMGMLLALALGGLSFGADVADYSGQWKLSLSKSSAQEISPETLPDMTLVIKLDGLNLAIQKTSVTPRGERVDELKLTTDGKETLSAGQGIKDLKSVCRLENGKLFISSEKEGVMACMTAGSDGAEPVSREYFRYGCEEEYSLSADGKTMTVVQKLNMPDRTKTVTLVFDRI
jgi:hypothetical protein